MSSPAPSSSHARDELASVAEALGSIRERIGAAADRLPQRARSGGARDVRAAVRRQLWGLAGELIGVQDRLLAVAGSLAGGSRPPAGADDEEALDEGAVLLATIQCVIRDHLDPAIDALAVACRPAGS